jgi:hypothetical protein
MLECSSTCQILQTAFCLVQNSKEKQTFHSAIYHYELLVVKILVNIFQSAQKAYYVFQYWYVQNAFRLSCEVVIQLFVCGQKIV